MTTPRLEGKIALVTGAARGIGAAAYAASKAAVRHHTKTVALYCAAQGLAIRCNSIHPAAILTPMWEPMLGVGPEREECQRRSRSEEFRRRAAAGVALIV